MKNGIVINFLTASLILISGAFCVMAFNKNSGSKNTVTFYKVPLVCSEAPSIGCGSKAKPVLQQLENSSGIAEAWLNHTGTVIALVWKDNMNAAARENTVNTIFKEQNMAVQLVSGKEYDVMLNDFNKKKNWLRNTDVNQLSMIEAGEIASRIVARVNAKTPLSSETVSALKTAFKNIFKNRFTTMNTTDINKQPKNVASTIKQKIENDLLAAGKKYLNATQMNVLQDAIALGLQPIEEEPGYAKDVCCKKK